MFDFFNKLQQPLQYGIPGMFCPGVIMQMLPQLFIPFVDFMYTFALFCVREANMYLTDSIQLLSYCQNSRPIAQFLSSSV